MLRKHWHDQDLKKRDAEKGRFLAHWSELDEEAAEDPAEEVDPVTLENQGFSVEEIEAFMSDYAVQRDALAVMDNARRTLRDARARQHAVRTARQYYPVQGRPRTPATSFTGNRGSNGGPMKCFRCGGPHKIA